MQNFFDQFDGAPAQPATPAVPGVIMGRPKPVDQFKVRDQEIQEQGASRDEIRTGIAVRGEGRDVSSTAFNQKDKLRADYDATPAVKDYRTAITKLATALNTSPDAGGDNALIYAYAKIMDPASVVRESEMGMASSTDSMINSIKARLGKEFGWQEGGALSENARKQLRFEALNAVGQQAKIYNLQRKRYEELARRNEFDPIEIVGDHDGNPFVETVKGYAQGIQPEDANNGDTGVAGDLPDGVNPDDIEYVERDSEGKAVGYQLKDGSPFVALFDSGNVRERDAKIQEAANAQDLREGSAGFGVKADTGLLSGLSDEVQGVGGAIGSLLRLDNPIEGYQFARDVARERYGRASDATGLAGDAVEIGSSLLVPFGAAATPARAARVGAIAGGVGGFGYGEGAQGSAINAMLMAGGGAGLGYLGGKASNALTERATAKSQAAPARNALLQAGVEEGTTVNRAMADPNLQSRVTGVSGTMAGSRTIEKEMGAISNQIEGRVQNLGGKGEALSNETGGGKVRAYAERQIEKSGKAAKRIYDNAEKASGNAKITPKESLARVDEVSAKLAETPGTNKDELEYLQTLKSDLSKDLSVGGLRRLRTKLRKSISKGDLVFGESEADVLSVMDAASNDIATGLTAQGKEGAAQLFKKADALYKERAQYIEGTLQKIIGKRNSTMSDQQVFAKFKSLADPNGDGPAMAKFMSELEPDEVADIAATFAADLGRNGKKEFSTGFLATQAEKLDKNPTALKAIFGEDGAKSVRNLIILSKEHNRVTNAARGSQTGIRADYRSWLTNALFTGGAGLMSGVSQGAGTGAVTAAVTAATVGGAKVAKDAFSARSLMSPKVTGWLRSAPRTADPKAIDAHFKKLSAIAKAEPAIAGDVKSIQDFIIQAANDNSTRAAASEQEPNRVRPEG